MVLFTMDLKDKIKKTKNLKERIRLCAILANANGHSVKTIAAILRISESTVYEYITEYEKNEKTQAKQYPGRSCKLDGPLENEVIEYLSTHSYSSIQKLCEYIEEKYRIKYSISGLRDWLNRKNLKKKLKKKLV